jgi:hypothetical protein
MKARNDCRFSQNNASSPQRKAEGFAELGSALAGLLASELDDFTGVITIDELNQKKSVKKRLRPILRGSNWKRMGL